MVFTLFILKYKLVSEILSVTRCLQVTGQSDINTNHVSLKINLWILNSAGLFNMHLQPEKKQYWVQTRTFPIKMLIRWYPSRWRYATRWWKGCSYKGFLRIIFTQFLDSVSELVILLTFDLYMYKSPTNENLIQNHTRKFSKTSSSLQIWVISNIDLNIYFVWLIVIQSNQVICYQMIRRYAFWNFTFYLWTMNEYSCLEYL